MQHCTPSPELLLPGSGSQPWLNARQGPGLTAHGRRTLVATPESGPCAEHHQTGVPTERPVPLPAADHSEFVGDLAPDVTDYTLQEHFRHFFASVRSAKAGLPLDSMSSKPACCHCATSGSDSAAQVITEPLTGRSKGYGFVRYGNEAERDRSLREMSGHIINSRPIRVSIATAKKSQTSGAVMLLPHGPLTSCCL